MNKIDGGSGQSYQDDWADHCIYFESSFRSCYASDQPRKLSEDAIWTDTINGKFESDYYDKRINNCIYIKQLFRSCHIL